MRDYVVVDYFSGLHVALDKALRFVSDVIDGTLIFDYTSQFSRLQELHLDGFGFIYVYKDKFKEQIVFDKSKGQYVFSAVMSPEDIVDCNYRLRNGFIYSFSKEYEANKHLDDFYGVQQLVDLEQKFKLSDYLNYTFGLEFETAMGIIPEDICFRDGLIPLRDGSIKGNEYSTVVLQGNKGLNLLKQQLNTLKEYTYFDKNCSLHIHLGGFEISPRVIFNIYNICYKIQDMLGLILPTYTFQTRKYKDTGKDYCSKLPYFSSFEELYQYMVERPFLGDLSQPHPNDIQRERKWNIHTRYYFVNFINVLCYGKCKTVEFRFLRPTYNLNKIIFWLYVFNSIVYCAEHDIMINGLFDLFNIYSEDIRVDLRKHLEKTKVCSDIQRELNDFIGARTDIEDNIFNTNELI